MLTKLRKILYVRNSAATTMKTIIILSIIAMVTAVAAACLITTVSLSIQAHAQNKHPCGQTGEKNPNCITGGGCSGCLEFVPGVQGKE
jgi:hypothetical protein